MVSVLPTTYRNEYNDTTEVNMRYDEFKILKEDGEAVAAGPTSCVADTTSANIATVVAPLGGSVPTRKKKNKEKPIVIKRM